MTVPHVPTDDDEDGDDEDHPSVTDVLFDGDGRPRPRRIWNALRARRSTARDLVPWLALALVAGLVGGPVWGFLAASETVLGGLGVGVVLFLVVTFIATVERVEDYYEDDEEIAIEKLRTEYADGEYDLEEFQRRVDRVHREGPAFVWTDETDDRDRDRDPATILEERFARGEIDETEFRRRMEVLEEPVAGPDGETDRERTLERET